MSFGLSAGAISMLGAGASVAGSLIGANSAGDAADAQVAAAREANELQKYMYDTSREDLAPWRDAGKNALATMVKLNQPGGSASLLEMDPSYQFRMSEGQKAMENSALARGGLMSGRHMKDMTRFGQGLASTEYGNSYNRLASLAGIGQTATSQGNQLGANYANQSGQNLIGAGNARASGYMGQANAINGGIGQAFNMYNNNRLLDMFGSNRMGGGGFNGDVVRANQAFGPALNGGFY